jgi:hypothetical protein
MIPAINLNVYPGKPFCMAFIFAQEGKKVYTGSLRFIREEFDKHPVCHGIIHIYMKHRIDRKWMLFGYHPDIELIFKAGLGWRYLHPQYTGVIIRSHDQYALIDHTRRIILGSWRRLPNSFMIQLKDYQNVAPPR